MTVMVPDMDQPDEETKGRLFAQVDSLTDVITLVKNLE
jgi:hypothetical protein